MIRILAAACAVAMLAFAASGFLTAKAPDWRGVQQTPIEATKISPEEFSVQGKQAQSDGLRFVGGLVLRSSNPHFGALSGLRITDDETLTAVTDTGFWFQGRIGRNAEKIPTGIAEGRMAPLLDEGGKPFSQKWYGDAEGLTFQNGKAYVSTEQDTRIIEYDRAGDLLAASSRTFGPSLPGDRLNYNLGLEAIATVPDSHPLAGQLLVISEAPPEPDRPIRAFVWSEDSVAEFGIVWRDGFFVTDADFLPDGSLLLLERKFSPSRGSAMRLRRIAGHEIKEAAVLGGETLLVLDRNWQIDNMEGLSVFTGPDGSTRIGLVSDDNHWPLQRTLYLEFILGR